jgi:thioredoxin-like negative regulator of GroEL
MKHFHVGAALTVLSAVCLTAGQTQEKKAALIAVKYDALKQEVLKQRGKVVVVDFWANW